MYHQDLTKRYLLENDAWKRDIIPEIMDGHNVLDFVDPDIEARLEALEREEDAALAALAAQVCAKSCTTAQGFRSQLAMMCSTSWTLTMRLAWRRWRKEGAALAALAAQVLRLLMLQSP